MVDKFGIYHGRGRRLRTLGLRFWRPPLYQLSYSPILIWWTVSLSKNESCRWQVSLLKVPVQEAELKAKADWMVTLAEQE